MTKIRTSDNRTIFLLVSQTERSDFGHSLYIQKSFHRNFNILALKAVLIFYKIRNAQIVLKTKIFNVYLLGVHIIFPQICFTVYHGIYVTVELAL